jgi:hypothetical protein
MISGRRARLALVAVVLAGIAVGVGVAVESGSSKPASLSSRQLMNAARAQARSLLDTLRFPPGSTRSSVEPQGDDGQLYADPGSQGAPGPQSAPNGRQAYVVAYDWWTIPTSPERVAAFLQRHHPRGAIPEAQVVFADPGGADPYGPQYAAFQWPPVPDLFGGRELSLTIMELASGDTGVLVYASVGFISPRGDSEQIPSSAGELTVTATVSGPASYVERRPIVVTSPSRTRRVVALLNGLPLNDLSTFDCNPFTGVTARVQFVFRSRRGGRALASATFVYLLSGRWLDGETCDSVLLTLGGNSAETPLMAQWSRYSDLPRFTPLLPRLNAALGGRLPTGPASG